MAFDSKTYSGKEMAAKMRDGDFDIVETLAPLRVFNAEGEDAGTAVATRVRIPERTLRDRLGKLDFEIKRRHKNKVVVELRV